MMENEFHIMQEPLCQYCVPLVGMAFYVDNKTLHMGIGVIPNKIYNELYGQDNPMLKEKK